MKIQKMHRSDLIKIATATKENLEAVFSEEMESFLNQLIDLGQYAAATPDEMERFDFLLEELVEASYQEDHEKGIAF